MNIPIRQIRALYDQETIRVYQAYNDAIADSALENRSFISPPFKLDRMTWIKPSFLWMMYRSGWSEKDSGQKRILAIDITRKGFEWALANSALTDHPRTDKNPEETREIRATKPVRIQWDPERDLHLNRLEHKSIQIGLGKEAVQLYLNEWIQAISDVTKLAKEVNNLVQESRESEAQLLLPPETPYSISSTLSTHLGMTT